MNSSWELALNLLWAGVSLTLALTTYRLSAKNSRGLRTVALLCLICLLFPAISITDDLSAAPALFERAPTLESNYSAQPHHIGHLGRDLPLLIWSPCAVFLSSSRYLQSAAPRGMYSPGTSFSPLQSRRPPPQCCS